MLRCLTCRSARATQLLSDVSFGIFGSAAPNRFATNSQQESKSVETCRNYWGQAMPRDLWWVKCTPWKWCLPKGGLIHRPGPSKASQEDARVFFSLKHLDNRWSSFFYIWGLSKIMVPENCPYAALSRTLRALSHPSRIRTWDNDQVFVCKFVTKISRRIVFKNITDWRSVFKAALVTFLLCVMSPFQSTESFDGIGQVSVPVRTFDFWTLVLHPFFEKLLKLRQCRKN